MTSKSSKGLPILTVVSDITGVPLIALLVMWYLKGGCKFTTVDPDGPFCQDSDFWTEQEVYKALNSYDRINYKEAKYYAKKPIKMFFLNALLAATSLRRASEVLVYPDMPLEAIQEALWAYYEHSDVDYCAILMAIQVIEGELKHGSAT